jgi:hypothetical protein
MVRAIINSVDLRSALRKALYQNTMNIVNAFFRYEAVRDDRLIGYDNDIITGFTKFP